MEIFKGDIESLHKGWAKMHHRNVEKPQQHTSEMTGL
jgi:hypothetical protein